MNVTDPERVYFSSNREFARGPAGRIQGGDSDTGIVYQYGALYEVEPQGEIEKDPDFEGGVSWCAPRVRMARQGYWDGPAPRRSTASACEGLLRRRPR